MAMMMEATVGSAVDASGGMDVAPSVGTLDDLAQRLADALRSSGFEWQSALSDVLFAVQTGDVLSGCTRQSLQSLLRVLLGTCTLTQNVKGVVGQVRVTVAGDPTVVATSAPAPAPRGLSRVPPPRALVPSLRCDCVGADPAQPRQVFCGGRCGSGAGNRHRAYVLVSLTVRAAGAAAAPRCHAVDAPYAHACALTRAAAARLCLPQGCPPRSSTCARSTSSCTSRAVSTAR
jgi:hypothetical protein